MLKVVLPRRLTRNLEANGFTALSYKKLLTASGLLLLGFLLVIGFSSAPAQAQHRGSSFSAFEGSWDLTLTGAKNLPSWVNVANDHGSLRLTYVGLDNHATWMKDAKVVNGELSWVSPTGQEGFSSDTTLTVRRVGDRLEGTAKNSTQSWPIRGVRAPSLAGEKVTKWGPPIKLFNGKNFDGWHFSNPADSHWKIQNGELVNYGHGADIITNAKFFNFKLHVEFNCGPMSNSGVYLRGRYETQIETDSASQPPSHHTGGIYGFFAPEPEQPRVINKWQTFDITLIGRTVTVVQNGVTVQNHKIIPGITGGALDSNEGAPGPIYLQGSEAGRVAFRNIVIRRGE